jgi:hypothetical protein
MPVALLGLIVVPSLGTGHPDRCPHQIISDKYYMKVAKLA